jgi:hypothetical protein
MPTLAEKIERTIIQLHHAELKVYLLQVKLKELVDKLEVINEDS